MSPPPSQKPRPKPVRQLEILITATSRRLRPVDTPSNECGDGCQAQSNQSRQCEVSAVTMASSLISEITHLREYSESSPPWPQRGQLR
eukprot:1498829-Pyramimonas_sp.AAC.1